MPLPRGVVRPTFEDMVFVLFCCGVGGVVGRARIEVGDFRLFRR